MKKSRESQDKCVAGEAEVAVEEVAVEEVAVEEVAVEEVAVEEVAVFETVSRPAESEEAANRRIATGLLAAKAVAVLLSGPVSESMANTAQTVMHIYDPVTYRPATWPELCSNLSRASGDTASALAVMEACVNDHDLVAMAAGDSGAGLYNLHRIRREYEPLLRKVRTRQAKKEK